MAQRVIDGVIEAAFGSICEGFRFEVVDEHLKNAIKGMMLLNMRDAGADDPYCFLMTVLSRDVVVGFAAHYSFELKGKKHIGVTRYRYQ